MTYKNKASKAADKFEIDGNSIGVYAAGSYYIKIYKSLFMGPKVTLLLGSVKNLEVTGLKSNQTIDPNYTESLSRADVSGVIRFKF